MIFIFPPFALAALLIGGAFWLLMWAGNWLMWFIITLVRKALDPSCDPEERL